MQLPVNPTVLPMLAKRVEEMPAGDAWIYEPKWDDFRALIFRDGDEILLQSRDQKSLNRYFPEVVAMLLAQLPPWPGQPVRLAPWQAQPVARRLGPLRVRSLYAEKSIERNRAPS